MRRPRVRYLALGTALGLGAPLGFLALRRLRRRRRAPWRDELRSEGTAYWYMALATPVLFGAFGALLGRREEQLRASYDHLERLREEFAAVVAHDLRTPIQAILLQLEILLRHPPLGGASVSPEALRRLRAGAQRLAEMVEDLLDATRIEAARLRLSPGAVSLPDAIAALVERVRPTLGARDVEVLAPDPSPPVRADPARLDQIVTNLLENAAKYSPEGAPIRVRVGPEEGGAAVAVEDEGWGIAPEDLPRLFDRFFQAKRARAKKSGLGLGLYITKGLVDAHGGRLTVVSELGRGSTFTAWFPAADA